jgi:hypothetical protein
MAAFSVTRSAGCGLTVSGFRPSLKVNALRSSHRRRKSDGRNGCANVSLELLIHNKRSPTGPVEDEARSGRRTEDDQAGRTGARGFQSVERALIDGRPCRSQHMCVPLHCFAPRQRYAVAATLALMSPPQSPAALARGDLEWTDCFAPGLTVMAQRCEGIRRQAAILLIARIASVGGSRRTIGLDGTLAPRDSSGRPT